MYKQLHYDNDAVSRLCYKYEFVFLTMTIFVTCKSCCHGNKSLLPGGRFVLPFASMVIFVMVLLVGVWWSFNPSITGFNPFTTRFIHQSTTIASLKGTLECSIITTSTPLILNFSFNLPRVLPVKAILNGYTINQTLFNWTLLSSVTFLVTMFLPLLVFQRSGGGGGGGKMVSLRGNLTPCGSVSDDNLHLSLTGLGELFIVVSVCPLMSLAPLLTAVRSWSLMLDLRVLFWFQGLCRICLYLTWSLVAVATSFGWGVRWAWSDVMVAVTSLWRSGSRPRPGPTQGPSPRPGVVPGPRRLAWVRCGATATRSVGRSTRRSSVRKKQNQWQILIWLQLQCTFICTCTRTVHVYIQI